MADPRPDFQELLDRINQGDERACQELYTHYNQDLWNFARMYLKHHPPLRSVCRESDVLQEAWQSAFDRLRKGKMPFETDAELLAWLLSIARHKAARPSRPTSARTSAT